jgi:hypothetical protein
MGWGSLLFWINNRIITRRMPVRLSEHDPKGIDTRAWLNRIILQMARI